ncbi:UvrD-helicase domain-containing protein [Corticimicrobacter populi]|nr:UvrD-helicase domain-containing protein [Corticimicrobacter populi]
MTMISADAGSGTERQPHDLAQRRRALDTRRSFLVQAPAGSGKTELLTDRILALLSTVQKPEEIVAITFTRKAAAEMHARVLEKLQVARDRDVPPEQSHQLQSWQLARAALQRDAELGWHLLDYPARLGIRTIDAFCASLVRRLPWLSELGGLPDMADRPELHYRAAARATLDMAGDLDAIRTLLIHMDVDAVAAEEALAGMLAQREQWLPLLAHGADRGSLEDAMARMIGQDMQQLLRAMPDGWLRVLPDVARLACAALDERQAAGEIDFNPLAALRDWVGEPLAADAHDLPRWRALAALLLTADGGLRKPRGLTVKGGFPPKSLQKTVLGEWLEGLAGLDDRWCNNLDAARQLPDPHLTDAQWAVLNAQLMALRLAAAQLMLQFSEAGEVDFTEIALRAIRALGTEDDPGELLLRMDASIRHLLIDEFQDTSQMQIRLLETLTSGWQPEDGRTLFLVGDPMQSIYRFRKAEVGLFLSVRDQGLGALQPEFLQLTDNFRSQGGIVEWVNQVFGQLLPSLDDPVSGAIRYAPSQAFVPTEAGEPVGLHLIEGSDAAAERLSAQTLVRLCREALERHAGSTHPVAVLVRARTHLGSAARALAQAGIACRAVELIPLARRAVVVDLVQLVRALVHPGDRLAWLSVLRAPWCGLTLDSLHVLLGDDHRTPVPVLLQRVLRAAGRGAPQSLAAGEWHRLARVAGILLDDSNASGRLPFAAWVEQVWNRLGGPGLYVGPGDLADAQSLFSLLERIAPYGALDLDRFEAEIGRLYASSQENGIDDDPDDASGVRTGQVEIMTMHKSKGLQFETVILYGLQRLPARDRDPLVRFEQQGDDILMGPVKARADTEADPVARYLARRERRRTDYETERLLYVAATRARKRLHLMAQVEVDDASGESKPPAASTLMGKLWPVLPAPGVPQAPVRESGERSALTQPDFQGPPLQRVVLAEGQVMPGAGQVQNGGIRLSRVRWAQQGAYDRLMGTVAHAWLARMGAEGLARWPQARIHDGLPLIRRQLTRAGVPPAHVEAAALDVQDTLLCMLASERGQWLLSQSEARREWPLLDMSGKVSILDLALEREGGWLVVDYKSGRPGPDESVEVFAERMRAQYRDQMQRYLDQLVALTRQPAQAALFFPRADLWLDMGAAQVPVSSGSAYNPGL